MAQEIADSKLIDTWSSGGNIVEPDISKIIEGWQLGEQPPHEYMNWLQNTFGSKLNHILKNGVTSWNNETEYLAGSSVQHNGNVWLCKTTNTNSAPTDVNANWKRIITIEALENLLVGYVATTGNQTIEGVKTFSSSPIVPTPTTTGNIITMDNIIQKTPVGIGYGVGAGGTVTQLTNKGTNVTLNKPTGKIITSNSALAAYSSVGFYLNNSLIGADDNIIVTLAQGDVTGNSYGINISTLGVGIVLIYITNKTGASRSESLTIKFDLIKGANS